MEPQKNEVTVAQPNQVAAPQTEAATVLSIIAKAAENPNVDISKMQALLQMQKEIMEKNSEIEFNEAFSRVSAKMPRIQKAGSVGYKEDKNNKNSAVVEAFKFARYEDIDKAIRPLLDAEGFTLSYDSSMRDGGGVVMTGTLSHRSGHKRTASIPLALDVSGGKNNIQAMGSTISYGKRYLAGMLLNIVTVGEDDDATASDVITLEQAVEIDLLIVETKADKEKFLKFVNAESVQEILKKNFGKAKNMLEQKKKKAGK